MIRFAAVLWRSRFVRHTSVLFSSAIAANLVTVVGFLLLAQYFSPGTLGELYVFTASGGILTTIALMGYHHAVPLMSSVELGAALVAGLPLASLIVIALSPLSFLLTYWYLVAPFVVASLVGQVGEMVLVREQRARAIALLRVGVPVLAYGLSLASFAFFGDASVPLLTVQTVGVALGAVAYWYLALAPHAALGRFREGIGVLRDYARFPQYIGPGMIFNTVAYSLPVLVAGRFFSPETAALYNMGFRLVFAPMQMLGAAVTQVYTGRLSRRQQARADLFEGYAQLKLVLFATAALACLGVYILAPIAVDVLLADAWSPAATYARAMTPLMFAMVAIAPLGTLFQFTSQQQYLFRVHALSAFLSLGAFTSAIALHDFLVGVVVFSVLMTVRYLFILRKLDGLRAAAKWAS